MKPILRILCAAACLLIGLSVVPPFFSVNVLGFTVSKDLMQYDGIYILIIAAAALAFTVFRKPLPAMFLGLVSLGMFFLENSRVTTGLGKEIDALARNMIRNGAGYYFLLAGSLALIIFSALGLTDGKRNR